MRIPTGAAAIRRASTGHGSGRASPAEFAAYREAVRSAALAFGEAERAALRASGAAPPDRVADWSALAQEVLGSAQGALARSADAWQRAERDRRRRRA